METGYSILVQWKDTTQIYYTIFLNYFLLDYTKNADNQRGFNDVTFTTASLPRQMLTTKQPTNHFVMIGLDNTKLCVVWRSLSLTYGINGNVERGNVWNRFLVNSVLVCRYALKTPQSDLGTPFLPWPPVGCTVGLPPALYLAVPHYLCVGHRIATCKVSFFGPPLYCDTKRANCSYLQYYITTQATKTYCSKVWSSVHSLLPVTFFHWIDTLLHYRQFYIFQKLFILNENEQQKPTTNQHE